MRLYPKLLAGFLSVAVMAVLVVAGLANRATQREVTGYMTAGGMATAGSLANELAAYYQGHGSWDGVEALLGAGGGMMGAGHRMMGQRLILADAAGVVAYDSASALVGETLDRDTLAAGTPIIVAGQPAGTLLAQGGMMGGPMGLGPADTALLGRLNRAVWLAALAAGLAALAVGGLLAFGLVRPIRGLTEATQAVARGQFSRRVPVHGRDEISELAAAFNQMAASLEGAERLRREMTADLAHELRNPIAVLQGHLEAVTDGVLPLTAETLDPLLAQTHLLARLVEDLRTLALADAGQLKLELGPADPAALAQAAAAQFSVQAQNQGVALAAEAAPGLPPARLDAQRISQVLGNLLSNALRHTPAGGRVTVRVAPGAGAPPSLVFTVVDTGPGVPAEALPRLFERFYRVDSARSRAAGGSGLGLAIARQIVAAHGGQIAARNRPEGGLEVTFTVPA